MSKRRDDTPTAIPKLDLEGLRVNIARGLDGSATLKQRDRAREALQEMFTRATSSQAISNRYHADHRNDRYDGLS